MIERFYLKNYLGFKEIELDLQKRLIVFTGQSGAGKSILLQSILGAIGLETIDADISEVTMNLNLINRIDSHLFNDFFVENEDLSIFKQVKKNKARYFLNSQAISKKNLSNISSSFVKVLSVRNFNDFDNNHLLNLLDKIIASKVTSYNTMLLNFKTKYKELQTLEKELNNIIDREKNLVDLIEFAEFEISRINEINPSINEYEKLLEQKKSLSKKDKIDEALTNAENIFNLEQSIVNTLELIDIDSAFFDDTMNDLRNHFDEAKEKIAELANMDIETLLNRLEKLSDLKRRYGSIEDTLKYRDNKAKELEKYKNTEFEKDNLSVKIKVLKLDIEQISKDISFYRKENIKTLEDRLNYYLNMLFLTNLKLKMIEQNLSQNGIDFVYLSLNGADLSVISSGELSRLRLAFLAVETEFDITTNDNLQGVLFLDEIDSNLSGEESQSVANVLKFLSKKYQILAISHQPQLTSSANQHFVIKKEDNHSFVKELTKDERIDEIARMVSGSTVDIEAKKLAKKLLSIDN